jgi:putative hydrolase of the HAD superfamily
MFDFGNVVGFFDYAVMFERFGRRLGIPGTQFERLMYERGAADLGREFERGRLTADQFAEQVMRLAGITMPYAEFEAEWPDIFRLNEPVARLVAALKRQGYTLLLGSNTNVLHARFYRRRFEKALAPFDHFVLSYEIGELKPELAFFAACQKAAGVAAHECVFIDDAPANVDGAHRAGLHAFLYRDTLGLIKELRDLGVEVPEGET